MFLYTGEGCVRCAPINNVKRPRALYSQSRQCRIPREAEFKASAHAATRQKPQRHRFRSSRIRRLGGIHEFAGSGIHDNVVVHWLCMYTPTHAVTPTAASHEVDGPAPLRSWPSGGMVLPTSRANGDAVCSRRRSKVHRRGTDTPATDTRGLQQPECTAPLTREL